MGSETIFKMKRSHMYSNDSVKKLLSHVRSTLKWRLMDRKPLERWVHKDGRVVLLGDACLPMLVSGATICICITYLVNVALPISRRRNGD